MVRSTCLLIIMSNRQPLSMARVASALSSSYQPSSRSLVVSRHRMRPSHTRGNVQLRSIGPSAVTASLAARPVEAATPAGAADSRSGKLAIAPAARPLTMADLAGEWTHKGTSLTRCVDRYTGAYAGDDSLTMRTTWRITAIGTITSDSFGAHNGRLFVENAIGRIRLVGNILHIRLHGGAPAKYVVRGWQAGLTTTVLKLNGPWHGDIPQEVLDDPDESGSCDQSWIRKAELPSRPR